MKAVEDFNKRKKELEKTTQEQAFGDTVMGTLANAKDPTTGQPFVSIDEQNKYKTGSHSAKQGIVMGKLSSIAQMLTSQEAATKQRTAQSTIDYQAAETRRIAAEEKRHEQAASGALTPIDEFGQPVDPSNPKAKVAALRQPDGQIHFIPKPSPLDAIVAMMGTSIFGGGLGGQKPTFQVGDKAKPAAPTTEPAAPPATAPEYSPEIKAMAKKALSDPKATPEQKAKAKEILGMQ